MVRKTRVIHISVDGNLASLADTLAEDRSWSRSMLYSKALIKYLTLAKYLKRKGK